MTDPLVTKIEGWMQDVGRFERADVDALAARIILPRPSGRSRFASAMVPGVGLACALVIAIGAGFGLMNRDGVGGSSSLEPSQTTAACPAALIEGELVASDAWGLALRDADGVTREVLWPAGYSVSLSPPVIALLDGSGNVIARAGDRVAIGGGEVESDGAWLACGGITLMPGSSPPATPSASIPPPTAAPPAPSPAAGPFIDCGRIAPTVCATAIALAREAAQPDEDMSIAPRIVADDLCPPTGVCDRRYPFDSVVVFATHGADTTGWYAFEVTGREVDMPTEATRLSALPPQHIVDRLTTGAP